MKNKKISEKQRQRFQLIETLAYWERTLNANILKAFLGLTWNMAIKELSAYKELHPKTFTYNSSKKVFITNTSFRPVYISRDWSVYHDHLIKYAELYNQQLWRANSVEVLPGSLNTVENQVIELLCKAIKRKCSISAKYASMQNPRGLTRIIHPHALAFSGRRWHLRGYSEAHLEFRDFNLSRIKTITLGEASEIDSLSDRDWFDYKTLCLDAHPSLNNLQKKLVLSDYDREKAFKVEIRAAMIKYFIKHHDIATRVEDDPMNHPLWLSNADELSQYLLR
ncbi:MAG: hypothetical protein C9356_12095 [Oleiphilus sp.]|nr:MAG: hypothetical protein C9356_12095 [Oleiphilus sp.]